jgi:predicted SprT family Zn-dependent metalloprotease
MNTTSVYEYAELKMLQHGLTQKCWKFEWTKKKHLGVCDYTNRVIRVNREYAEMNSEEVVYDTVLHEIAHALDTSRSGHGYEWRRIARSIGARAECKKSPFEVKLPTLKYTLTCSGCGVVYNFTKLTVKMKIGHCGICSKHGKGQLKFNIVQNY